MNQNSKFKELTTKQKIGYIWEYYRLHILGALLGSLLLIMFLFSFITEKEAQFSVIMINAPQGSTSRQEDNVKGFDEFLDEYGYENYDGAIEMISDFSFPDGEDHNAVLKRTLESYLGAGIPHVFFGNGDIYMHYVDMGVFTDLSKVLPEEILQKYEEHLVYSDNNGEVEPYPCAIYLTDNAWVTENGYYDECYFGIVQRAPNMEIAVDFAEYILR